LLIVLDTNVIVSGLINPRGAPARVIDLVLSSAVQVAFDDRILAEYAEVLTRPPFAFPAKDVNALLDHIQLNGIHPLVGRSPITNYPDPDDAPFAEVALEARVDALVTGNAGHFAFLAAQAVPVLSPSEFLTRL
jgi:uncharacterized protein